MPINPGNKRDSRSAAGTQNMLSSLLGSRAERHQQEDFYPIASDTNSIYASSNTGKAGPSSAIYTDPSVRSLGPDSEGDYEVNDQMSTEPVPADFNYQTVIAPSSPSSSVHHLPITRSKARARAQALKRSENEDLGDPIEDADLQEPERYNDEHLPLPNSPRRKPAPKKAKSRTKVLRNDSFDGSVDERDSNSLGVPGDSASGSGSYISSPRGDEDDIYSLYETDAGGEDSEASAIADITNRSDRKGKGRAITTTYSAKSGNKKVSKTRRAVGAAKKTGAHSANKPTKSQKPVRGNQVPDVPNGESTKRAILAPVSCQNTQVPTQASLGTVSASYSAIQKALSPLAARSKGPTHRKPKKPFDASNLDRSNTSLQGVSPSHGDTSIYQHSMTQPRSTGSSPSTEIEPPVGKIAHTTSQNTRSTLSVPSFKPERKTYHPSERSSNAKQEGRSITCNQQDAHPNKLSDPFTVPSPEQHANSTSAEYGHTHPRIRPSYDAGGGPSKRPSGVEPSIRPIEKVKAAPKRKAPFDDIQASTAVSSPRADADPVYCRRLSDLPGDADLADHSVAETLHPDNYGGNPGENEEFPGDYGSRYESSVPMQIDETPKPPSMEDIPSRIGAHSKQAANKKLLSPKSTPPVRSQSACTEVQEPLHPNSMIWAANLADISRTKHLTSMPSEALEDIVSPDETPSTERNPDKPQLSEREITLQHRRCAISESVQEVTTAMLQHMQSKEPVVDKIVENHRRKGQQLVDRVLDHQAVELNGVVSAFDRKCMRLGKIFDEGARLARRVRERVSNEDNQYHRAWSQRKKDLDEEIKIAWELVDSV